MNTDEPGENATVLFDGETGEGDPEDPQQAKKHQHRIAFMRHLPPEVKGHLVALAGEFVGTFMFLFFAFAGTQVANFTTSSGSAASAPNTSNILFVSLSFGFSLAVNAWVFFRISGGLFNPAVTFGMCLIGAVTWIRGVVVVFAQIVGAIAASGVVSALFPGPLNVTTGLNSTTSVTRGVFIEMFLTAELVFTIFMLAAEKNEATFIAPVGIGLSLFIAELGGVYFTGGSLNPARSFGPAVVGGDFDTYHWIYWIGPMLGALVAVAFYKLVKGLEYETINAGEAKMKRDEKEPSSKGPSKTKTNTQ